MEILELQHSLSSFQNAHTIKELEDICHDYCHRLGFDNFVYALRIPENFADSRLIVVNGYPELWVDHYFQNAYYTSDPVMTYCAKSILPIEWKNLPIEPGSSEFKMMNDAKKFGLQNGVSMPIHTPHGEFGILSFSIDNDTPAAHETTYRSLPFVQILASHIHETLRRISGLYDEALRPLSKREQECLKWAADGKAAWEIAHILRISERTVNFHLNNTMQKLEVCNRQHAVAKATLKGLIQPSPF
ncbi:MAG: LuxR family transcriptional regulator [Sulfuricurvum sp.]|uniref:autoinducer binding domain-containing protein n=3 Tax=Sulfuricurvum TaxID=286130 RepID=UPI0035696BE5